MKTRGAFFARWTAQVKEGYQDESQPVLMHHSEHATLEAAWWALDRATRDLDGRELPPLSEWDDHHEGVWIHFAGRDPAESWTIEHWEVRE